MERDATTTAARAALVEIIAQGRCIADDKDPFWTCEDGMGTHLRWEKYVPEAERLLAVIVGEEHDRLRNQVGAAELTDWIHDWRAGRFDPSYDKDGWPIEMHGLVADLERMLALLGESTDG